MEVFPDVAEIDDHELKVLVDEKLAHERTLSDRRSALQAQIDVLREERAARLRRSLSGPIDHLDVDSDSLGEALVRGTAPRGGGWAPRDEAVIAELGDVAAIADADLRRMIADRTHAEQELSFERRMLHGHIDLLHVEVTARLARREGAQTPTLSADDTDQLKEALAHRGPPQDLPGELDELDELG